MDLQRALAFSRYAHRTLTATPALAGELAAAVASPWNWAATRAELAAIEAPDALARALRHLRQRVFLHTMVRDLAGMAPLDEVGAAMTTLAEVALDDHGRCAHARTRRDARCRRTATNRSDAVAHVVGMGKLGGGELNVSSDIDLVFVYPEEGDTTGPRRSLQSRVLRPAGPARDRRAQRRDGRRLRVPGRHAPAARTARAVRSPPRSRASRRISSPRAARGSATRG